MAVAEEEDFELQVEQLSQGCSQLRRVVELVAGDESQEAGWMADEGVSQEHDAVEIPGNLASQRVEVQGDFTGRFAGQINHP